MTYYPQPCLLCFRNGQCSNQCMGGTRARGNYNIPPPPKGCICPPGSEATCQRWDCGRKTPTATTATGLNMQPKEGGE